MGGAFEPPENFIWGEFYHPRSQKNHFIGISGHSTRDVIGGVWGNEMPTIFYVWIKTRLILRLLTSFKFFPPYSFRVVWPFLSPPAALRGTGSTAYFAVERVGQRIKSGGHRAVRTASYPSVFLAESLTAAPYPTPI